MLVTGVVFWQSKRTDGCGQGEVANIWAHCIESTRTGTLLKQSCAMLSHRLDPIPTAVFGANVFFQIVRSSAVNLRGDNASQEEGLRKRQWTRASFPSSEAFKAGDSQEVARLAVFSPHRVHRVLLDVLVRGPACMGFIGCYACRVEEGRR